MDLAFLLGDKSKELDLLDYERVLYMDSDFKILYTSDEVQDMFPDCIGMNGFELIHPDSRDDLRKAVSTALMNKESFTMYFSLINDIPLKAKGVPLKRGIVFMSKVVSQIQHAM